MKFIHLIGPDMIFGYFVFFGGSFLDHFWVFEIFKNVSGMRICDFVGVFFRKFIHLRAPYMIFGCLVVFRGPSLGSFLGF